MITIGCPSERSVSGGDEETGTAGAGTETREAEAPDKAPPSEEPGSPAETEAEKKPLTLTFVGDIIAHEPNYTTDDYSRIYAGLEGMLTEDDLTFGNIEYPMVPEKPQASFPIFNIYPEYTRAAADAGVDVFSLANNHTLDQREKGALRTREVMEDIIAEYDRPLYASGVRYPEEKPFLPVTIEHKGWKIGFLAVTQFTNIAPDEGWVTDYLYLVDAGNREEFLARIVQITPEYDLFILSYHGDMVEEYVFEPNPDKEQFFRDLLEAGVDIVYGHHPHVLQPYEVVERNGRNSLILYSVGNFISGQGFLVHHTEPDPTDSWAYTHDSAVFTVTVTNRDEQPHVTGITPLLIGNYIVGYEPPDKAVLIYPLEQLTLMDIDPKWRDYYRERYSIMSRFLSESRRYTAAEVPVRETEEE
jgi:poly-gamma-glutamate synthesis protein (capsule biosynthesis protein)